MKIQYPFYEGYFFAHACPVALFITFVKLKIHTYMKGFFFALLLASAAPCSVAQQKLFTLEDAMLKARATLAPENLPQLQFVKGMADYLYTKKQGQTELWMRGNFKTAAATEYLPLTKLNVLLKGEKLDTLTSLPPLEWSGTAQSYFVQKNKFIVLNHANAAAPTLQVKEINVMEGILEYNPVFSHFAYLKDNNLFVSDFKNATQLTTDGSNDIIYAQSVHREEFGISKGQLLEQQGNATGFLPHGPVDGDGLSHY